MSNYWSPQYILCAPKISSLSSSSSPADNFGMASGFPNDHHQQDHIPSTSDNPSSAAAQQQIATRPDVENVIQGCHCSWCSRPIYDHQAARHTGDYPAPWFSNDRVYPFANESLGITDPTGIPTFTNGQAMVRPVGQQAPWDQGYDLYAPRYDAAGFLQAHTSVASYQAQIDMPVLDSLQRFSERDFNNPEPLINAVHFDYGPSGRLQLVITLEIPEIRR